MNASAAATSASGISAYAVNAVAARAMRGCACCGKVREDCAGSMNEDVSMTKRCSSNGSGRFSLPVKKLKEIRRALEE